VPTILGVTDSLESVRHRLDVAAGDLQVLVELDVPETGPVRYHAELSGAALGPGFVIVHDDAVPRPRGRHIELRTDGLWTEMICETDGEHWSFGLEAFGLRVEDPGDEIGERVAVGYDLEWEVPDHVHGEVLVERARIAIDGRGTFTIG
jgi:hypothetical protein